MKQIFFLAVAFLAGFSVMAQQKTDQLIKLNSDSYNFGKIKQGVPVTTYFEVKNISNQPIVIESATAGCGCTTPEWSKEPIAPGATSKIKVGYNAAALNHFDKTVTIKLAGVPDAKMVTISGDVLDVAAYDEYAKSDEYKKSLKATTAANTGTAVAPTNAKTTVKEKQKDSKEKTKVKTSN